MNFIIDIIKSVPIPIQFFYKNQNSETDKNENLQVYHDLFSKIEETTSSKIKEQDKILILKQLDEYSILFAQQAKSDSHNHNLQLQIEQEEKNIMNSIRKLKSEISFSFLYDQFCFIKNNKYFESTPFIQCLSDQKEASSKISYLTQINFSRLYGLTQHECSIQFNNELKTKIALQNLSDKDILNIFFEFYFDLILDLLYRRIPLTSLLKQVQSQVQFECLQNLNVSNILTLVFERLNLIDKINLGQILSCSYQSIPIFYKIGVNEENYIYKDNLISAFYSLMDSFQSHIILNVCSSSIQKQQREDFFNYLSSNKDIIADLKEGFNQRGTIHLYSQFSNSKLAQFILFDNSQLDLLNIQFLKIFTNLMNCSSVILIHLNFEKDFILYANKYVASIEFQKLVSILNQKYLVIFIIHKAQKHKNQVEKYLKEYLEYHKFEYQLVFISENDSESEYDMLFSQLKESTFQESKKEEIIQSFEELMEAYISKCDFENLNTPITQYKNLIEQKINEQLKENQISDKHKLIQLMFSYSNMFSELFYQEKIFDNLSRSYFKETEIFVKKGEKLKQLKKKFESCNQLSQINLFFFNEITQNNYIKMSVISKILSDWKQPMVEENNKQIDQINQEIRNLEKVAFKQDSTQDQNKLEQLYKQKNQLIILQDNYDISVESFIREISLFTQNVTKNQLYQTEQNILFKVQIQKYYQYAFQKGIPIQFIDKTRQFGSNLLESFFKQIDQKFRWSDYKIVSVVGPQSSAKSTLMNYLFRCSFETSSARCTKGMYFTKINFQGMNLLVIDTEGLLSNIFRDQSFDNSVMTLLFLISHVIIFNIKDESNSKMKEMMSITEEVIKLFNNIDNNYTVPEVFISLRDYFDRNNIEVKKKQIINEMIQVNGIFESQSQNHQNKNQIKLKSENIFIFPSAFSELNRFNSRFKLINTGFGEDVLQLRQSITNVLKQSKGYLSIQDFYSKAEQIWNRLKEHGHDLLKCITLQEYQSKKKLEEIALDYQKKIEQQKLQVIQEKEAELKNSLIANYMDNYSLNRIKDEYKQFMLIQNHQMNEELENQLQQDYIDNRLINQLSPRDFNFILNKIQHRNKVNLLVRQNIYEQRLQSLFFGYQIDVLEKEFSKQIQQEVNQAKFEQNQQSLQNLLDQIQEEYTCKIKQLQKNFETTDELMRQQLEQLKNEFQHYDQNLQSLIQEFSITQIAKQTFENEKNIIEDNQENDITKKFLIDSSRLSSSEKELLIIKIQDFFKSLKSVKQSKIYQEQEIVKKIFQLMTEQCQLFFDQIQPNLIEYINETNVQKYTFYILYKIIRDQVKKQKQEVLLKKMQKFQNIVDQKIQYIKKMSETSTDWEKLGEAAMREIQNKIVRKFIKKLLSKMEPIINKTVEDLTSDYTKAIDNAFSSVYDSTEKKIIIDNFLKYTVNINKYIDEMKRDQIKIKADELVQNKTAEFNLGLYKIIDDLNDVILYFLNTPIFDFKQLIDKLNSIYFEGEGLVLGSEILIQDLQNKPQFIEEEVELEDDDENSQQGDDEDENQEEEENQIYNSSFRKSQSNLKDDKDESCQVKKEKVNDQTDERAKNDQNEKNQLVSDSTDVLQRDEISNNQKENEQIMEQFISSKSQPEEKEIQETSSGNNKIQFNQQEEKDDDDDKSCQVKKEKVNDLTDERAKNDQNEKNSLVSNSTDVLERDEISNNQKENEQKTEQYISSQSQSKQKEIQEMSFGNQKIELNQQEDTDKSFQVKKENVNDLKDEDSIDMLERGEVSDNQKENEQKTEQFISSQSLSKEKEMQEMSSGNEKIELNQYEDNDKSCSVKKENVNDLTDERAKNDENEKNKLVSDSTIMLESGEASDYQKENEQKREQFISSQSQPQEKEIQETSFGNKKIEFNQQEDNDKSCQVKKEKINDLTDEEDKHTQDSLQIDVNESVVKDAKDTQRLENFCQENQNSNQDQSTDLKFSNIENQNENQIKKMQSDKNNSQSSIEQQEKVKQNSNKEENEQDSQKQDLCSEERKQESTKQNCQSQQSEKNLCQAQSDNFEHALNQEDNNQTKQEDINQVDQIVNSSKKIVDNQGDGGNQCLKNNQQDSENLQFSQDDNQMRTLEQQFTKSETGKKCDKKTKVKRTKKVKKQIPVQLLYIQGMRKVYDEINPSNGNKIILKFKDELNNDLELMLKNYHDKMIGCQERCPFCGQKCHLELGHSGDHSVNNRHLIIGIHGFSKEEFYCNKFCYDTIKEPFSINYQRFENMYEASQKLYPKWQSCFVLDKIDDQDQNFNQILKQGYALTAKWFREYNNTKRRMQMLKENVPQEFKDLAQNQEEVDEKYKIQWKYQDNQSNDQSQDNSQDSDQIHFKLIRFEEFLQILKFIFND